MKKISVQLDGYSIDVEKLPLGKYADLLAAVQELPKHISGIGQISNEQFLLLLPKIISNCYPDIVRIFTVATPLAQEQIENLSLDEAVDVVLAIIEVNKYKAIAGKIKKVLGQTTETK